MSKITGKDIAVITEKYGVSLRTPIDNNLFKFITGTGEKNKTNYTFNYCGVTFSYELCSERVEVKNLPFEVAKAIYNSYPDNPYGICYNFTDKNNNESVSPYMGVTDTLYEANLAEFELYAPKDEWSKLVAGASTELMRRPDTDKYIKFCKIYTKEGLDLMMSELSKYVNTLDKWAYASNVKLPMVDLDLRNTVRAFDNTLGLETNKTDLRTGNSIEHVNKQNSFSSQVKYEVGNGRIMIVTHSYNKEGTNDSGLKGEFISVQMFENNELVNEMIYNLSEKECFRLKREDYSYQVSPINKTDEEQIIYILRESTLYAESVVNSNNYGLKK